MIEIAVHKSKDARGEVVVVACSAADGVRGGVGRRRRQVVGGVYRVGIESQFVMESFPRAVERNVEILGRAVAAGHRKSEIQATVPAFQKPGMQAFLVSLLLGGAA